jgi:RNA-binding protein
MDRTTRARLRGQAHRLKPLVAIGDEGLTDAVITHFATALQSKELVKVRFPTNDRPLRKEQQQRLAEATRSEIVLAVGKTATYYRESEDR